jgi:hypothetical protein
MKNLNKKGAETWQIALIVLGLIFLIILLAWYSDLGSSLGDLFKKFGDFL